MVIHDAIAQLDAALPEEKDCSPDTASLQKASVKLLQYLWKSKGHDAAASARICSSRQRSAPSDGHATE